LGSNVTSVSRGAIEERQREKLKNECDVSRLKQVFDDVTCPSDMDHMASNYQSRPLISDIIYAVGDCPPGGFDAEVATPLTDEETSQRMLKTFKRHVTGLCNVVSSFHQYIQPGGCIVVIGSAITRLTTETCPDWLFAGHYAAAIAAQAEYVKWLRMNDPNLREKSILVHRIAPVAVDTVFHKGCEKQPPAMLTLESVAERVFEATQSKVVDDCEMVPAPPRKD